jgi:hypothetical protein
MMDRTTSFGARILSLVLLLTAVTGPVAAGAMTTDGQKCASAKTRAAGKAMSGVLKCQAAAVKRGMKIDQTCVQLIGTRLQDAFSRAEAAGTCAIMGDLPTISDIVADFLEFIVVQIPPLVLTPVACNNSDSPQCDGTCPPGQFCAQGAGVFCQCRMSACGEISGDPSCYGECPPEAPICASVNGSCQCTPGNLPCGQVAQGAIQCDGACPAGQICVPGEYGPDGQFGQQCYCRTAGCGNSGIFHYAPQCWGECDDPNAPYCRDVGGFCQCSPTPN